MNVVIVHGCNDNKEESLESPPENERHWKPWLKRELEKRGIEVSNELYPEDWNPSYEEWKKKFEENKMDEDTVLIGHSCGGGFLVRWLAENKKRIRKLILVSPGKARNEMWESLSNLSGGKTYSGIDKYSREGIVLFTSDNDIPQHIKNAHEYEKGLPAKIIVLKNHGHFTLGDMGTEEFPELLEEVLE